MPIMIRITYIIKKSVDGLQFVQPDHLNNNCNKTSNIKKNINNAKHFTIPNTKKFVAFGEDRIETAKEFFQQPTSKISSSPHVYTYNTSWLPCYDSQSHLCTWKIVFILPNSNFKAICAGKLADKTDKRGFGPKQIVQTYKYPQLRAREIGFVLGKN
eukprot:UN30784